MKLFCTGDLKIVHECQQMFGFKLPSELLEKRRKNSIIIMTCIYTKNCSLYL